MAKKRKAPVTGLQKHAELEARKPPLRGEEAKPKIDALHAQAEHRYALHMEAKTTSAAKHNSKAVEVVAGTKLGRQQVQRDRKLKADTSMSEHLERRDVAVSAKAAKGAAEASKVALAVAALHEEEALYARTEARLQDDAMHAAEERRLSRLEEVAARGAAETDKVEMAAAKLREEAQAKARYLEDEAAAANARRATKIGEVRAKGAAELAKVERVHGRKIGSRSKRRSTPSDSSTSPASASPPLRRDASDASDEEASPPGTAVAGRRRPPVGGEKPTASSVHSEANLMLLLMRGGAPNIEVLNASSPQELIALASKYRISLPGVTLPTSYQQSPLDGGGAGSGAVEGRASPWPVPELIAA